MSIEKTRQGFKEVYIRLKKVEWEAKNFEQMQSRFAFKYRDILVSIIKGNQVGGPPLSVEWLQEKIKHGGDTRKLIDLREYIDNIRVFKLGNTVLAGVDPRSKHKGSGLRLVQLAAINEYGFGRIPPRPHHAIARKRIIEYMRQRYKRAFRG